MGWVSTNGASKQDIVRELVAAGTASGGLTFRTLRHAVKGSTFYAVKVVEQDGQEVNRFLQVSLLQKFEDGWGSKDMDEGEGPVECMCPLSFFDLLPPPNQYAERWRARCRLAQSKIEVGDRLRLHEGSPALGKAPVGEVVEVGKRGRIVARVVGKLWRIPRYMIESVEHAR